VISGNSGFYIKLPDIIATRWLGQNTAAIILAAEVFDLVCD